MRSAGLLVYRLVADGEVEVLCAHMGGPFWARKDDRAWSIPKGEYADGDDAMAAARREFVEEIGREPPEGSWIALGEVLQPSGKRITAWAVAGDLDVTEIQSNMFALEWPRGSGRIEEFPEVDRAEWLDLEAARRKLVKGQVEFLDRLKRAITP